MTCNTLASVLFELIDNEKSSTHIDGDHGQHCSQEVLVLGSRSWIKVMRDRVVQERNGFSPVSRSRTRPLIRIVKSPLKPVMIRKLKSADGQEVISQRAPDSGRRPTDPKLAYPLQRSRQMDCLPRRFRIVEDTR